MACHRGSTVTLRYVMIARNLRRILGFCSLRGSSATARWPRIGYTRRYLVRHNAAWQRRLHRRIIQKCCCLFVRCTVCVGRVGIH